MADFETTVLQALDGLQTGQVELQANIKALREDVSVLQSDVRRLEVLHEETTGKIDQIIETVSPNLVTINEHTTQLQAHDQRITLLEKSR